MARRRGQPRDLLLKRAARAAASARACAILVAVTFAASVGVLGCGGAAHPAVTGAGGAPGGAGGAGGKVTPLSGDWQACGSFGQIGVQSATLSNDGRVMALAFYDLSVDVIRVSDGATLFHLPGAFPVDYLASYYPIALSPDGQLLAVTEPEIHVFRVADGSAVYRGGDGMILSRFSPDGTRLIGIVLPRHAQVVHLPDGAISGPYGGDRFINEATFSPEGAVITIDDTNLVRDETNNVEWSLAFEGLGGVARLSPLGRYVSGNVPGTDGTLTTVYRIADRKLMWSHLDPDRAFYPSAFFFSPDDSTLVQETAEEGRIFDVASGTVLGLIPSPLPSWWLPGPMGTSLLAIDSVGARIWTGGDFVHGRRLNTDGGAGNGEGISSIAVAQDGRTVAIASAKATTLWDLPARRQRWAIRQGAAGVAISPDGARVLVTRDWIQEVPGDFADGDALPPIGARCVPSLSASYARDGTHIGVSLPWGFVLLAGAADPTFDTIRAPGLQMAAIAFSPDGLFLASSEPALYRMPDLLRLWPTTPPPGAPANLCTPPNASQLHGAVAYSPDGTLLAVRRSVDATMTTDARTTIHRAATGVVVHDAGPATSSPPVFSPDSAWLLAGKTLQKVDLTHAPITFDVPDDQPVSTFAPDGTILIGTSDGRVHAFCPGRTGGP